MSWLLRGSANRLLAPACLVPLTLHTPRGCHHPARRAPPLVLTDLFLRLVGALARVWHSCSCFCHVYTSRSPLCASSPCITMMHSMVIVIDNADEAALAVAQSLADRILKDVPHARIS